MWLENCVVETHRHNRTTFAVVSYLSHDNKTITVTGSAHKHPNDKNNPELGVDIAVSRALRDLSHKLYRRSMNIANHQHHTKTYEPQKDLKPSLSDVTTIPNQSS